MDVSKNFIMRLRIIFKNIQWTLQEMSIEKELCIDFQRLSKRKLINLIEIKLFIVINNQNYLIEIKYILKNF